MQRRQEPSARQGAPAQFDMGRAAQRNRGAAAAFERDMQDAQDFSRARYGHASTKKAKGKSRLWTAVMVFAAALLVVCLAVLGVIGWGYFHGTKVYDEIAESAFPAKEADGLASMTVDWAALQAQNPDTVAWVYMPGTSIDYPIVQGETDEEYLKKDFTGDSSGFVHKGTIFLSTVNKPDFSDENNFIYGHNMNDNTMFAYIRDMEDQAKFDASRTFYVLTPTMNYKCTTAALDVVQASETDIIQTGFANSDALLSYIKARMEASVVQAADVDPGAFSKLFTLITCGDDYATTRCVLLGGVVETAEPANATAAAESAPVINDRAA